MPDHDDLEPTDELAAPDRAPRGVDDLPDVTAAIAGDPDAFARLYDRWYEKVHDLAYRVLRDHELAAEVAQDTFVRAYRGLDRLADPLVFGGWLLRIARNGAYDRSERERRSRAVDDEQLARIERVGAAAMSAPSGFAVEDRLSRASRPEDAVEDAELVALVWDAADALGERDREVLDLHLRHGLDPAGIAEVLGINRNAANQTMHRVRQRLATAIAARVLWRSGDPQCAELRAALDDAGRSAFDGDTVRLVDRHAASCERCEERRRTRLDPAVLFSALPMVAVPAFKARVAAALAAEGVPVPGLAASPGDGRPGSEGRADGGAGNRTEPIATVATTEPEVSRRSRRAMVAGAIAALVLVLAAIGLTLVPLADDDVETTTPTVPVLVTTTLPVTSAASTSEPTAASSSTVPRSATTTTAAVVVTPTAPPTTAPPAPTTVGTTTTTPPAPSATLQISRSTVTMPGYSTSSAAAPRVTWSATNVSTVTVTGTNLDTGGASGSAVVCPGIESAGYCTLTPSIGTVTYTLRGRDAGGAVVITRTVTLTVTV